VTKLSRPAERATGLDNRRGTAEQWLKEGKSALMWTRLACCSFAAKIATHARHLTSRIAEIAVPEELFGKCRSRSMVCDQDRPQRRNRDGRAYHHRRRTVSE